MFIFNYQKGEMARTHTQTHKHAHRHTPRTKHMNTQTCGLLSGRGELFDAAFCNAGRERKMREREMQKYAHTHTQARARTHMHVLMHTPSLSPSHTSRTCTHAHTHTHTHTIRHTHAYAKICMRTHNQARTLAKWKQHLRSESHLTFYSPFA